MTNEEAVKALQEISEAIEKLAETVVKTVEPTLKLLVEFWDSLPDDFKRELEKKGHDRRT